MNEREFGGKIARYLNVGLKDVDELTAAKLKAARLRALDRAMAAEPALDLASAGHAGAFSDFFAHRRPALLAPLVAFLLAAAALFVWHGSQTPDPDDVDVSLLTGELPISAYLDQDFDGWQKVSSQ